LTLSGNTRFGIFHEKSFFPASSGFRIFSDGFRISGFRTSGFLSSGFRTSGFRISGSELDLGPFLSKGALQRFVVAVD
jgi:hypothetical protein